MVELREYSTYRVVTTSRLKALRYLVVRVHDNLKAFTNYSERSVQTLQGLPQLSVYNIHIVA